MDQRKIIGLVCAALAAGLLILAAFSNSWIIGENFGIQSKVGLRSVDICADESSCERVSLGDWSKSSSAPKKLSTYIAFGKTSFFVSLATAGIMLVLLGYGATDKTPHWPVHPGTIALLLSIGLLFVGVLTLALHPFKMAGWGTGPGFMLLAAGDVAALAGGLVLGRSAPPTEDDWFE